MAKITYADKVALNENPNINAINKVRDVDMNEIKEVINDNETKVLLAVSSSAPATCDTGDIYFNTTDNLIYTATATDTWSTTGVAPTENTIYIEFTSQTAYAYDGTTLILVGNGSGASINVNNTYSNSQTDTYSCDYSNKAFSGTLLWTNSSPSSSFSNQTVEIDLSNYDMIEIIYYTDVEASTWKYQMTTGKLKTIQGDNILIGGYIMITTADQAPQFFGRRASINVTGSGTKGIVFNDGKNYNGSTYSTRNVSGVPLYIIGYKTGLFS